MGERLTRGASSLPAPLRSLLFLLLFAAPAAAQPPVVEAEIEADLYARETMANDELFLGCSLGCAYGWTTAASSHLAPQGAHAYDAERLYDGSARTAWVEGAEGDGVGERLTFTILPEGDADGRPVPLWGLDLVNGYAKSEPTWAANGRLRELAMAINGEPVRVIRLQDSAEIQTVDLGEGLLVGPGDVIELEIRAVYPGARYRDTALSELVWHGAH